MRTSSRTFSSADGVPDWTNPDEDAQRLEQATGERERFAVGAAEQGESARERRAPLFEREGEVRVRLGSEAGEVDGGVTGAKRDLPVERREPPMVNRPRDLRGSSIHGGIDPFEREGVAVQRHRAGQIRSR